MSDKNSSSSSSGGTSFIGLLTIAFIVLKLTHFIDWSWWWVLSPIWISLSVVLVIVLIMFGFYLLKEKKRREGIKKSIESRLYQDRKP